MWTYKQTEPTMWTYKQTEPTLWTVGHYSPDGEWHTDSDHDSREAAAERCAYLNGARAEAPKTAPSGTTITRITVSYSETVSIPDYSNVKPSITLEAVLGEGQDPEAVRRELAEKARAHVQEEVNRTLEQNDKIARYHDGPTYQVKISEKRKVVAVFPDDLSPSEIPRDFPDMWGGFFYEDDGPKRGMRIHHARRQAERVARVRGWLNSDCSDGNLDRLPPLPEPEEQEEAGYSAPDEELIF